MSDTTTDVAVQTNTDAPIATVPFGVSEVVSYVTALAALLNGFLGHDYGLSANAQAISVLIAGLVVLGSSIARAVKHHSAMQANAAVYSAQLAHVTTVLTSTKGSVAALSAGVSALNSAVAVDTGQTGSSPS